MNTFIKKMTQEDIDLLLNHAERDSFNDITWKVVTEEEIDHLLKTP
ncbi:hypothetical protein V1502_10255 [Bacillus sp. SCS-153A]